MKELILESAENLMLAQGYSATSLGQICKEIGVSKAGLFHHFQSKEDLGKAILERFCDKRGVMLLEIPPKLDSDPAQTVYNYIDSIIEFCYRPQAKRTCLLAVLTQEMSATHPEFRNLCEERFRSWAKKLSSYIEKAKEKHVPQASWQSENVADHFISVLEGSLILAKAKQDIGLIEINLKHFKAYLISLFKGESHV
jgi:TetR/AcrR family transcriptional repressor of nem operon